MKRSIKVILVIPVVLLLLIVSVGYYLLNDINFLFGLMLHTDSEKLESYALEKVLKVSKNKDVVDEIIKNLHSDIHKELNSYYILTLGIIGDKRALPVLTSLYVECQKRGAQFGCNTKQYFSVISLGLIGDEEYEKFLSVILDNYDMHPTNIRKQIYALSLYLMTGKQYEYVNDDGVKREFQLWGKIIKARETIIASKNRNRSLEEMMVLFRAFPVS